MLLKEYAKKYVEIANKPRIIKWKEKKIKDILSNDQKILDIGGGGGEFKNIFHTIKMDYYLIDYNPVLVEYCISQGINAIECDLSKQKIPFEDNYFDLIHISHVFEHLNTDEQINTFQEFERVLKKGGKLVLFSPSPYYFTFWDDFTHKRPCTHIQLERLCNNFQMEVIECKYSLLRNLSKKAQNLLRSIPIFREYLTEVYLIARKI